MTQSVVKINFFGAFRKYGDHEILSLPEGGSAEDLKNLLAQRLSGKVDGRLIRDSAIACNDAIVGPDHRVRPGDTVCILPPVCGG